MKYNELVNVVWEEIQARSIDYQLLNKSAVHVKGLPGSLKTLFLASFSDRLGKPILAVFPDREEAEWVAEEMASMMGAGEIGFFPGADMEGDVPAALNPRKIGQQMEVIRDLLFGRLKVITTSAKGVLFKLAPPEIIRDHSISLSRGSRHDLYLLVEKLLDFGFSRESMVERPGEVSLRGGILDVFPFTGEEPHRFEFFGDLVESIRTFDIETQQSIGEGNSLTLIPPPALFSDSESALFSYLPADHIVFVQDPELVTAEAEKSVQQGRKDVISPESLELFLNHPPCIHYHTFSIQENAADFGGKVLRKPGKTIQEVRRFFQSLTRDNGDTTIFCQSDDQRQRLSDFFEMDEQSLSQVQIEIAPLQKGFELSSLFLTVYSESDLFGRVHRPRKPRFKEGLPIRELSALSVGDYVVHVDYGIGKYLGLQRLSIREVERECLAVEYMDGDKLYVPVDKMQRVQKYAGKEGAVPVLSKLGGNQWEKLKARTKDSIKNIAKDLISIYSARQILPGFAFSGDSPWQRDLESSFPYDETPDQNKAIDDVKSDLEQTRPMDRLVCGDVGYGKTEVAIRAAFKVANDGKQVAMLVPTTILAQQHFNTFQERLSGFPFTVEMLSRFRNVKEQKEIIDRLKAGRVDIVIGTHRLFSKDVSFKDLGLLIIDEEQRFGVRHKERLKAYRKTVDVLALSATPIPRTLYLSLMNIRDMSIINTAPKDRQPIITEVLPFSEEVVSGAIQRELSRGGQVFFVHNRIQSIYAVERMVRRLIPGIRTAVAHGQMDEHHLEKVMLDFTSGKYDCLVATMIIESGLDLPHVNTMLVNRADRFGLAQLYQLRGRVGRSEKRAYAFLFTPPFQFLTPEAVKRLRTIEEFTELGSGFQIAMRDLEIRGAGNLLGVEQSGNMDAVGYDLYIKLVEEAVHELKMESEGGPVASLPDLECQIDTDLQAILPEEYVADESLRVNLYKRLASIRDIQQVDDFEMELKDRFGLLPNQAQNLMKMTRMKIIGQEKGFKRIVVHKNRLHVIFHEKHMLRYSSQEQFAQYLRSIIDSIKIPFQFHQKKEFGIQLQIPESDTLAYSIKFLQCFA